MCTSFAVYNPKPIYGMNFDFPDVELKIGLVHGKLGPIFFLSFERGDAFYTTAGMNSVGLFSAAQILVAHFDIILLNTDRVVSPYEMFISSLQDAQNITEVLSILGSRRLGYSTERKGHQLYADRYGNTCILEPGQTENLVYPLTASYTVMANRPFQKEIGWTAVDAARLGIDRCQIATRAIQEKCLGFSVEDGFDILKCTSLTKGKFTTQSSIVCDPETGMIYLALKRNFDQIWRINLREGYITTHAGFRKSKKIEVGDDGITSSQLIQLAHLGS